MNTEHKEIADERFVLAFYGVDHSPKAKHGFFKALVDWFSRLGYPPDNIAVEGQGFSGKVSSFNRTKSRLDKVGFNHITSFTLLALMPNSELKYYCFAYFNRREEKNGDAYAVVAAPSTHISSDDCVQSAQDYLVHLKPSYGIAFRGPLRKGPELYPIGITRDDGTGYTGEAYEEQRNISFWKLGMELKVYRDGILRDVYPGNFLNSRQVGMQINGIPLEKWIGQSRARGTLSPVSADLVFWQVEQDQIPKIRNELKEAGLIFDWRKYPD